MLEPSESEKFIEPLAREVGRLRVALLCLGGMVVVLAIALIVVVSDHNSLEDPSIAKVEPAELPIFSETDSSLEETKIPESKAKAPSVPLGYKTVSIPVDAQQKHPELLRAKTKVNVAWSYNENGQEKLTTLVRNARVLTILTDKASDTPLEATLLIREEESSIVELAKDVGKLSLAPAKSVDFLLAAKQTPPASEQPKIQLPAQQETGGEAPEARPATMEMYDPAIGEIVSFELVDGAWKKIEEVPEAVELPRTVSSFQPAETEMRWNPIGLIIKEDS